MRRMAFELLPAVDGPRLQLLARSRSPRTRRVCSSTQMGRARPQKRFLEIIQSPMFLSQSSSRSQAEFGDPADVAADLHDLFSPRHADEPFVDQAKEQLRLAAPAVGVAVRIFLDGEEDVLSAAGRR